MLLRSFVHDILCTLHDSNELQSTIKFYPVHKTLSKISTPSYISHSYTLVCVNHQQVDDAHRSLLQFHYRGLHQLSFTLNHYSLFTFQICATSIFFLETYRYRSHRHHHPLSPTVASVADVMPSYQFAQQCPMLNGSMYSWFSPVVYSGFHVILLLRPHLEIPLGSHTVYRNIWV